MALTGSLKMTDKQNRNLAEIRWSEFTMLAGKTSDKIAKIAILLLSILAVLPWVGVASASEEGLPPLEGVWFTCEFATRQGPPDDGCAMFDDEGFAVTGGKITYLRNIASAETACRGNKQGQCFAANTHNITVSERPIGAARIEGQQLLVSYMGCTQKFDLLTAPDYVSVIPAKDKCIWMRKRHFYVAPYKGKLNRK
jgi:hypothetical protein